MTSLKTDVLVIGGGATGAAVAWDCALRGFDTILAERRDLAEGTSGRFHGLLHSGGRYAVKDPNAAVECVEENAILRRLMPDCIEDTGGFFVLRPATLLLSWSSSALIAASSRLFWMICPPASARECPRMYL